MDLPDNIREIELTQGQVALVDAENFEWLNQLKWCAALNKSGIYYALHKTKFKNGICLLMHRVILGVKDRNILVDHKDRNGLHNYLSNLRIATHSQNVVNRRSKINGSSKYLGVCWHKECRKWVSHIKGKGCKLKYLGIFDNEINAAIAYDTAAKELHGQFANLNFKEQTA